MRGWEGKDYEERQEEREIKPFQLEIERFKYEKSAHKSKKDSEKKRIKI